MTAFTFLSEHLLITLFVVAIFAGFIDAISGGGGLISLPAMLLLGIPPSLALGTNRLQASIGEATSFATYLRHGQLDRELVIGGMLFTALGALAGTGVALIASHALLDTLIPFLMLAILLYTLFSKKLRQDLPARKVMPTPVYLVAFGLLIGFYNGFFGPGTGALWVFSLLILQGMSIKHASMTSKPLNLTGNVVSLAFFMAAGSVNYAIGLAMGAGQILGAYLGSHLVMRNGSSIVRPLFIVVTGIMTARMFYQNL
ncbi:TSUP family transporter [Salinicola endophyticus]|uniref:Probable membrane transporter protein n=1 Tax=Salinicola endophyticus TaxID=1949083 RepID=A0AB74U8S5_9GAMM